MSDFDSGFWSLWVAGLTLLSIVGCALLLTMQSKRRIPGAQPETTGHEWDGDLTELNNPLPRWWMYLFWITIFFALAYLVLYPGLGTFGGTLRWSSAGEYQAERAAADAEYGPRFQKYATLAVADIAKDPAARVMGERLFLTYCAQCHGSDARGAKGFPDLTAGAWLYGGDADALLSTILDGRKGQMPAMGAAIGGPEGTLDMANYVLSLSGAQHDAKRAAAAQPKFAACAACHEAGGAGNPQLGAPNLADKVWLHGGSLDTIAETIAKGRQSQMPAHRDFLGEEKSRILAGYVYGISPEVIRPVIPIVPVEQALFEVHRKIYPRAVHGWFARWRWALVWATQVFFYGMPWVTWNQRPALLFDLAARKFYVLGFVFWPQDFIYLTLLLVASALALFLFTAVAGRLWCGYACPQTVYTEIFLWVERRIEGDKLAREKLDRAPLSGRKVALKGAKHAAWAALGLWTGFTFVGYFTPIRELGREVFAFSLGPWEAFWILFYGLATYGNAGWLREQVCKHMCPYARFQGAMFDRDTLIIGYDRDRGEPRGSRSRKADPQALGLGSCVDCDLCVQVCPTGIDIRKGLQIECIGCAACIDACDQVMEKMSYPKGLIRYSTENALARHEGLEGFVKHVARPRTLIYAGVLAGVCALAGGALFLRVPLKVDVIRDRGTLVREVEDGELENIYRLQVMNATEAAHRYRITVEGVAGVRVASGIEFEVDAAATKAVPVRLRAPRPGREAASLPIRFSVASTDAPAIGVTEKSVFLVR